MSNRSQPMRRLTIGAVALLAVLALAACGSDSDTGSGSGGGAAATTTMPTPAISGMTIVRTWDLSSYISNNTPVPASSGATMTFAADGTFTANTGCNVLNGSYTTSDRDITITPGPMTMRACTDPALDAQEQALVQGLPQVARYSLSGEELTLAASNDAPLFLFSAGPDGLDDTSWKITGVNNGQDAVVGTSLTEALTLEFATGGVVSGFNGCNNFSGTYTTNGSSITISTNMATTLIACEPDVEALAQQYMTGLTASTTFELFGPMLTLRDAAGATQVAATSA